MSPRCRCVASCIFLMLQANCSWKDMFVCLRFTNVAQLTNQDESDVFFHLATFAAVGSCCCIAFRAKLYTGSSIIVRVLDQVMMFAFLTDSTTVLLSIPWHSREKNMFPMIYSAFSSSFLRPGSGSSRPSKVRHLVCSLRKFLTRVDSLEGGHLFLSYVVFEAIAFQKYP